MLAKVETATLVGLEGARIEAEVNLANGLPAFSIVGLPDVSIREARDRVMAAIRNSGFDFPLKRITVNLAPAELRKEGTAFDLAIAMGLLLASDQLVLNSWPRLLWLGELALDGTVRPVRGALAIIRSLASRGYRRFVVPPGNIKEIAFVKDIEAYPIASLREAAAWVTGDASIDPLPNNISWSPRILPPKVDFSEIRGQQAAKRAMEIAAAGGHNVLLVGPPGTGKSLLAQALPSVMASWTMTEALDATQIHSVAGLTTQLIEQRPYRTPHHSISTAALIGGGEVPLPGEISLAHRGVLFLDEIAEFSRDALEALRQPLEEGSVHLHRVRGRAIYPCQFLMVAAMNPCPCGYRGHPKRECICTPGRLERYLSAISGPLFDRIDLHIAVPPVDWQEFMDEDPRLESSQAVRSRVEAARALQMARYAGAAAPWNGALRPMELRRHGKMQPGAAMLLKSAVEQLGLSARAFDRIRRVALTIADLAGADGIGPSHIAEAVQFRSLDRSVMVLR